MSQSWPGQKVGTLPPAASAPRQSTGGGPVLRPVLSVPDPNAAAEEARAAQGAQNDLTRTNIAIESDKRAESKDQFDRVSTYRKEFLAEPIVREFRQVKSATQQIVDLARREGDQPGPGDIALIISFMKALDPGSVVRETEFATAENAGGVPEAIRNAYNKLVEGGRLTPEIKREFARTATSIYNARRGAYNSFAEDYRGLVSAEGADPDKQGIRLADEIVFDAPALAGAGRGQGAGDGAPLTPEQQDILNRFTAAYDAGASLEELRAIAPGVPFQTQAELDAARKAGRRPTFVPPVDPRDNMGVLDAIGETFTGRARTTDQIEGLADWTDMPELNSFSLSSAAAGLGTLLADPAEAVQVIQAQFPGVQVSQDAKGNFILRSSIDGKEYAIKPGFRASDLPRAAAGIAAFTPAGRATTLPGSFAAGAGTQAIVEGSQAATGGNFSAGDVLLAGGANMGGTLLGRGVSAAVGGRAAPSAQAVPEAAPAPRAPQAAPTVEATAGEALAQPVTEEAATEFGDLARQAVGRGKPAQQAREQLAIAAKVNPEAKAAAERLGIDLPVDVLSDDARLLTAQGLARSQISSDAQTAWGQTVSNAIQRADDTLAEIGGTRNLAQVSEDVRLRLQNDMDLLEKQGAALRREVDDAVNVQDRVDPANTRAIINQTVEDMGGVAEAKQAFTAEEKKLFAMLRQASAPEAVTDVVDAAKAAGVRMDVTDNPDKIILHLIDTSGVGRGQGIGTEYMKRLLASADAAGKRVELTPDTSFGASSKKRLTDFYRRFGFVENKGRNKDFTISQAMYRLPQPYVAEAKGPTYARLNQMRDQIGRALHKGQGPWVDAPTATLKKLYGALAQDQLAYVESVGGKELADKMRGSNELFSKMFGVRDTMQTVFGRQLEKDIGGVITSAVRNASKGDGKNLRTLLDSVPADMQPRVLLSGIMAQADRAGANGGFSFTKYASLYRGLRQNAPLYKQVADTVGPDAARVLQDLYAISNRIAAAENKIIRTGASNQPILNALKAEGLLTKTVDATKRVGARAAGATAGGMVGGPVGSFAGQEMGAAISDALTQSGKSNLNKLHDLLASDAFRELAEKAATGEVPERAVNKVVNDGAFRRWSKFALGLKTPQERKTWLMGAMNAPASNVVQFPQRAGQIQSGSISLAAEEDQQTPPVGSNTTAPGTR